MNENVISITKKKHISTQTRLGIFFILDIFPKIHQSLCNLCYIYKLSGGYQPQISRSDKLIDNPIGYIS